VISHTAQLKQLETKLEVIAQTLSTKHDQNMRPSSPSILPDATGQSVGAIAQLQLERDAQTAGSISASLSQGHLLLKTTSEAGMLKFDICEDEVLFDRYKRLMAPNMPFVVLPPNTSAASLAHTEHILMDAIRVVACFHDSARQQALAKDLMRQVCETLLINGNKSLGLLQGLLIFSNWYNPHLYIPQNSTNILHLAIALSTDLNLDRGPGTSEKARMEAAMRAYGVAQSLKHLTNDERRAVLGTFYLTSVASTSFRKVDTMHWTPWLAECASMLSEAQEYQSDSYLVQLVQMQRIAQETTTVEYNAPCQFYAKSFLKDLDKISKSSGGGIVATVLQLQDACTRIAIWQRSFTSLNSEADSSDFRKRLEGMWHCIEAVKAYMDIYMDVPVNCYLLVPFGVFAQFAYAFVVMIRALSLEVEGWDAPALRKYIDLSEIAENASHRYAAVTRTPVDGINLENEAFSNWGVKLRLAKTYHDAKITPASHSSLGKDSNHEHVTVGLASGSSKSLPDPSAVGTEFSSQYIMGFEDLWTGLYDPSQASADFGLDFGNI
jgi:hypothetical protein